MSSIMATVAVAMALSSGAAPASAFLAPAALSRLSSTSHSYGGRGHGASVGAARGSSSAGAAAVAASLQMVAQPPVKPQKVCVGGRLFLLSFFFWRRRSSYTYHSVDVSIRTAWCSVLMSKGSLYFGSEWYIPWYDT